jgi:hypothetical protein
MYDTFRRLFVMISQTNTVGNNGNVTDVYGTADSNTRPNNNGTSTILSGAPNWLPSAWLVLRGTARARPKWRRSFFSKGSQV